PDLFFTAPSTPIRVGGSRLLPPPEEQTDGESEGLCSPPTSPSGSYMTAEGGSWGSSGTASTSPSCSPNLVAEAEGMGEAEAMVVLPPCLDDPPAFTPPSPEEEDDEEEDGPFAPPGDEEDDDGQTPEEDDDEEEWEVSGGEGLPGMGLIPAALLPFRGSLLFQAEAVEIAPLPPGTAPLPLSAEEEDEEEEEEEEGGSTSASFLRSLSETSITEGVDESFAFRDDTSASSDSAAYDGEEDERLYGTERHAMGAEGGPPSTAAAPPGTGVSSDGGIELHLHAGLGPILGGCPPSGPPQLPGEELAGSEEEPAVKDDSGTAALGEGPGTEPAVSGSILQPPSLCSGEPRTPQPDGLGDSGMAPANGVTQGSHGSDGDDDGDYDGDHGLGTMRMGSTEPAATDGHDEPDTVATDLVPPVTPSPPDEMDTVAADLVPPVT
ncbi:NACAD protein, partial [Psophia crepitans]|nr:NACAD protein [Psophia crepitans]